jgi:hypothetical protein
MNMNPEVKAKWVAALRSGKYIQGHGRLSSHNQHCCLGVLCEVMELESHTLDCGDKSYLHSDSEGRGSSESSEVIPPTLAAELNMHYNPYVMYKRASCRLSSLNDDEKLSFNAIADIIEASL